METRGGSAPLTAEQLRDTVSRLVEAINGSDPAELARGMFGDNGGFAADLIATVPRLVSAAAQAVKVFAETVESMPAEKSAELLASPHARISGAEIAEAVNALSRLIIHVHEQNPELLPETRIGTVGDFMLATDFGKLRKAVTYRACERLDLLHREVEVLGESPMALINMFSVVAPVINDALPLLKTVFDILALPAEAVTYALFKILQDIDWREFAAVMNSAAAFVVNVHRGSLILGDGSLYTRGPFHRISSDVVGALDGQVLAEAIAAVGEEAEALLGALANRVMENESLAVWLFEAMVSLANSSFLLASSILEKANSLPRETLGKMAASLAADLEVGELGRAIASLAAFGRRIAEENPELMSGLSRQALSALGLEASPEAASRGVNRAIASYNAWAGRNPGVLGEKTGAFLAGIDARELERAAKATGDQVADALSRNPAVIRPLLKAAVSVIAGGIRGYVKGIWARTRTRGV